MEMRENPYFSGTRSLDTEREESAADGTARVVSTWGAKPKSSRAVTRVVLAAAAAVTAVW